MVVRGWEKQRRCWQCQREEGTWQAVRLQGQCRKRRQLRQLRRLQQELPQQVTNRVKISMKRMSNGY